MPPQSGVRRASKEERSRQIGRKNKCQTELQRFRCVWIDSRSDEHVCGGWVREASSACIRRGVANQLGEQERRDRGVDRKGKREKREEKSAHRSGGSQRFLHVGTTAVVLGDACRTGFPSADAAAASSGASARLYTSVLICCTRISIASALCGPSCHGTMMSAYRSDGPIYRSCAGFTVCKY